MILALVGWLILAAQAPPPKAEAKQQQPAIGQRGAIAPTGAIRVEIVNQATEPAGYQDPCGPGEERRDSELCAQWTAADAATDAAYYARLQLWGAAAGIIGLLVTIWLTRRAVKAAQASVAVAQDTAKRQLRAYVGVSDAKVVRWLPNQTPCFVIVFKNAGQTPAFELISSIYGERTEGDPNSVKMTRHRGESDTHRSTVTVLPNCVTDSSTPMHGPLSQADYDAVALGTCTWVVGGFVAYFDAFKKRRLTVFRFYIHPHTIDPSGQFGLRACDKGNRAN